METVNIGTVRKRFWTVFNLDLLDNVKVTKMENFLKENGWMRWDNYFWGKSEIIVIQLATNPDYPGMLLEDAYEYELKKER